MKNPSDPIFILFCFLSEIRNTPTIRQLRARLHKRKAVLMQRLDFYVHLGQACHLLTLCQSPQPTILSDRFFDWEKFQQYEILLDGWVNMIQSKYPQKRRDILRKIILNNQPDQFFELSSKAAFHREMQSLAFLNLVDLGETGQQILLPDLGENTHLLNHQPWQYRADNATILVPLPANLSLLWALEKHLLPQSFRNNYLVYSLKDRAFSQVHSKLDQKQLNRTLRQGLQTDLPEAITNNISSHPQLRYEPGYLITFCNRDTLGSLRRDYQTRKALEDIISPYHVFVPMHTADEKLHILRRKGLIHHPQKTDWPWTDGNDQPVTDVNFAAELLMLAWYADKQHLPKRLSHSNLQRLINALPSQIVSLALQKAESNIDSAAIRYSTETAEDHPDSQTKVISELKKAINLAASITILYRKAGEPEGSTRKILPLAIEQLGMHVYLVAFCEKRCARRTFRLDRLQIIDEQ